jgi:hypothetical protein
MAKDNPQRSELPGSRNTLAYDILTKKYDIKRAHKNYDYTSLLQKIKRLRETKTLAYYGKEHTTTVIAIRQQLTQ